MMYRKYLKNKYGFSDYEISMYKYGFLAIVLNMIPVLVVALIGYEIHLFRETIIYLVLFCPLRAILGGIHCKKMSTCMIVFILLNSLIIWNVNKFSISLLLFVLEILFLLTLNSKSTDEGLNENTNRRKNTKKKNIFILLEFLLIVFYKQQSLLNLAFAANGLNIVLYLLNLL